LFSLSQVGKWGIGNLEIFLRELKHFREGQW